MRYALLIGLAVVSGCAPTLTGANERGGMISHVMAYNRADSLAVADAHCNKFGRVARVSGLSPLDNVVTFDCVER